MQQTRLVNLQNTLDNVLDFRLAKQCIVAFFRHTCVHGKVEELLGDEARVMEYAHIQDYRPFHFQAFIAVDKQLSAFRKNDVS